MGPVRVSRTAVRGWVAAVCTGLSLPVQALEVVRNDVAFRDGTLYARFEARVDADADAVYGVVTDFESLDRLSRFVTAVEVSDRDGQGRARSLVVVLRGCILVFCREAVKPSRVSRSDAHSLHFIIDAGLRDSDFLSGEERLSVSADGAVARVRYDAELQPRFRVPRWVVPNLLAGAVRRELVRSAQQVEALAASARH